MIGSAAEVAAAIRSRHSFILTSHARPDGDAIGSELALALALDALGKRVRIINRDPAPESYRVFPSVDRVEIGDTVSAAAPAFAPDEPSASAGKPQAPGAPEQPAVIMLECGSLDRAEVAGLDGLFLINIDHHPGNPAYGAVNWIDESAAACAELVADLIDTLGVPWTPAIATHLYLGIVTDTGGFRHANITADTFTRCRRIVEAGVDVAAMARQIFDSFGVGRLRITGALLAGMELHAAGRLAVLSLDDDLLARCGATVDDTENLVNLPLGARDVLACALLKRQGPETLRVSLRSKGTVDVRQVAAHWKGGGHVNAAGCTIVGAYEQAKARIIAATSAAMPQMGN